MDNFILWLPTIVLGVIAIILMAIWVRYTFSSPVILPTIKEDNPTLASPPKAPAPRPLPSMMTVVDEAHLVVLNGSHTGKEFSLKSGDVYVGRLENPEENILIAVDEKSVSRRHAKLSVSNEMDELSVQDCSSSFGTQLLHGDAPPLKLEAEKQYRLSNGDILQFGNLIKLEVVMPGISSNDLPDDQMTTVE